MLHRSQPSLNLIEHKNCVPASSEYRSKTFTNLVPPSHGCPGMATSAGIPKLPGGFCGPLTTTEPPRYEYDPTLKAEPNRNSTAKILLQPAFASFRWVSR